MKQKSSRGALKTELLLNSDADNEQINGGNPLGTEKKLGFTLVTSCQLLCSGQIKINVYLIKTAHNETHLVHVACVLKGLFVVQLLTTHSHVCSPLG